MIARERSSRPSRIWLVPAGALLTVLALSFILGLTVRPAAILAAGIAIVVAIWAVVQLRAERTAHETALASWAESEAIVAERIRIARDLHDIVSHGLGMITVRAATTRYLNEPNPNEQALLEAIEDVETLSRQTTLELRRMLETLREVNEPAPLHPVDTLNSLPEIIERVQRAGLSLELHQGHLGSVSSGAQLAICSIVREGLDNCARHAGLTRVQLTISRAKDTISVTITDEGPGPGWNARPGAGHGLIGLRERVHALGGTLTTGADGTGFRLEATLPDEIQ